LLAVQPFGDDPLWAVHPNGEVIVVVERAASASGEGGRFDVRWFGPDGGETLQRSFKYVPRRLQEEYVEEYVTERVDWLLALDMPTFASRHQAEEAVREALFLPGYLPPVDDVLVGRSGEVWLKRERTGFPVQRWDVLGSKGNVQRVVCTPAGIDVMFVDSVDVYGVELDERDIPTVVKLSASDSG